ncbi:elongator complex protein 1 [Phoenix dactylifera]|uniref:Elongator complex protein 1 n=1 Tax=Phoenix dactylifera TaxID=42345 RepID=A0A8B7D1G4_PHODC|nr:elongator complex protein 1 [Phoenix dactylifera]
MKNLKLSSQQSVQLDLQFEGETLLLSAFDIEHNRIFFASSANVIYTLQLPLSQHLYEKGVPWSKALLSSEPEPIDLEPGDSIVAMDYLIEKEALMVGTSSGCLVLLIMDSRMTELIGRVEGGVKSIASSPDGALFAVTTGSGQLLVMTHDWEVLYETALDPQLSDNVFMDDMDGSPGNGFQSSISWRVDGKYFATLGGVHDSSSLQKLRVWERESGMLHSASNSKTFMGKTLDWMPSGAKLAAVCDRRAENKCPLIVFFEKNGLERNSFSIDEPAETTIEILKWNCNSDLLAASVTCDQYDAIKIWSFSNYHCYLKQEVRYSKKDEVKFAWNPTKPLHLICWTLSGMIISYNFVWMSAVTETTTALVIDKSSVLVTPLALSLMPPPMSLFSLKFHTAVQDIAFISKSAKNYMAAHLSDGSLCAVELPTMDLWDQFEGKEFGIGTCLSELNLGAFMHLTWLDSHILLGVSCCQATNCSMSLREDVLAHQQQKHANNYYLQEIELVCSEDSVPGSVSSSGWRAKISNTLSLEGPVIGIVPNPAKRSSAFVQMNGGSVFEYTSNMSTMRVSAGSHSREFDSAYGFPSSCPWMKAVAIHDKGVMGSLLFGLDDSGRLHVGRRVLCNSCSSFSFYSNTCRVTEVVSHLILTTKQDLLFIISIDDILHGDPEVKFGSYSSSQNQGKENKEYVNIWERGATVIGVMHGDEAAVLLQTNRGNLECIYPRKLVLVSIINALVQGRFRDAMLMVRRHRIDFNVIIDYCGWKTFLKSAAEFVSQVNNLGHITDFVCSIKNENVINTLYKPYISPPTLTENSTGQSEGSQGFGTENKIFSVLLAVRRALEERMKESPERELCILTTLARSEPPALEEALNRIKVIRQLELSGVDDGRQRSYPSAEESLKHLLWLTDPEAVYEAALGLYDLNLAAIVALNSQKDPKEFLPFLKGLENLPPAVMRYTIDLRLRRYESALKHIVSAGDAYYEDCINLLKNNPELFPLGLQLFTDDIKRRQVQEAWGDHLHAEKCFEDAGVAYLCCSSYQKALRAYRACGDWRDLFIVAGLLKLGKEEILHLANELCEEFQALGNPAEAAKIALEYCADVARGVNYFIMAREWDEALRVAFMNEREDLISDVKDATLECATTLISEYKEGTEKVGKYLARYLAVRQRRIVLAARIQSEDRLVNDADYDTVSETSSRFSEMSAYTTRTAKDSVASISSSTASKSRDIRRQRHKGGKIRAGSPGEEMALVEHLKGMSLTASAQHELKSLLKALVMLGKEEIAQQIQSVGDHFQLTQEAAVKLAEDTMTNETVDENTHTLEHYVKKLRAPHHLQALCWQSKVLMPPLQGHRNTGG